MWKWLKSPNSVYLRGIYRVQFGFFMIKSPWLVFRMKHKFSNQKFVVISIMEKCLSYFFIEWKKLSFCYSHTLTHERVWSAFFHIWKLYDNELCVGYCTHRVISDKVHRLLVTLSYFRPVRFVQLLSLILILILLLDLLVSIDLVYTGLRELVPISE